MCRSCIHICFFVNFWMCNTYTTYISTLQGVCLLLCASQQDHAPFAVQSLHARQYLHELVMMLKICIQIHIDILYPANLSCMHQSWQSCVLMLQGSLQQPDLWAPPWHVTETLITWSTVSSFQATAAACSAVGYPHRQHIYTCWQHSAHTHWCTF
jgi:hypothetical protein